MPKGVGYKSREELKGVRTKMRKGPVARKEFKRGRKTRKPRRSTTVDYAF